MLGMTMRTNLKWYSGTLMFPNAAWYGYYATLSDRSVINFRFEVINVRGQVSSLFCATPFWSECHVTGRRDRRDAKRGTRGSGRPIKFPGLVGHRSEMRMTPWTRMRKTSNTIDERLVRCASVAIVTTTVSVNSE